MLTKMLAKKVFPLEENLIQLVIAPFCPAIEHVMVASLRPSQHFLTYGKAESKKKRLFHFKEIEEYCQILQN